MMRPKFSHDALAEDLAAHLRERSDRVVWTNLVMGSVGNMRPDVYTVPKSFARFCPIAYEVKASRADFLHDVTAGKYTDYYTVASGVVFACEAGLLAKSDIPSGCGLMVRGEKTWTTLKGPTLRKLDTLPHRVWIKLLIDGLARSVAHIRKERFSAYAIHDRVCKRYGVKLAQALSQRDTAAQTLLDTAARLRRRSDELEKARRDAVSRAACLEAEAVPMYDRLCTALGMPLSSSAWEVRRALERVEQGIAAQLGARWASDIDAAMAALARVRAGAEALTRPPAAVADSSGEHV